MGELSPADSSEPRVGRIRNRPWLRRLRIGCLAVAVLLLVLLVAGRGYESWARSRDLQRHPAPGKLIKVDSHRLHLRCIGDGTPAVIFDAGAGGTSLDWDHIQQQLALDTQVCAYDRAGFGWSDLGPSPRTSAQIVHELRTLLRNANVEPPFILVGHSFGGLDMQLFAARHANEVAGLVLVDSVHPDLYQRMPPKLRQAATSQLRLLRLGRALAPYGLPRLLFPPIATQRLSPHLQAAANAAGYRSNTYAALYEEARVFDESCQQVRSARRPLDNVRLTVLTRSKAEKWPSAIPAETAESIWLDLQRDLAAAVPDSQHMIVENAGHFIHLDQPDVVVEAIQRQLRALRN